MATGTQLGHDNRKNLHEPLQFALQAFWRLDFLQQHNSTPSRTFTTWKRAQALGTLGSLGGRHHS